MKVRTINDLHNKEIGHKRFARFVDLAIEKGHEIKDIKEYNEMFKFVIDNEPFTYSKDFKDIRRYMDICENLLYKIKKIKKSI